MPQAVTCRCSGKGITGIPTGLEISELCREQLNTLTTGDDFGFLCWKPQYAAGHLFLRSFAWQPWVWRQNRIWCMCAYIHTHRYIYIHRYTDTYGHFVLLHGANQKRHQTDKGREPLLEHLQLGTEAQGPTNTTRGGDARGRGSASQPKHS